MTNTKPRRKPKRPTGEQIVLAILDAAETFLVDQGLAQMTTNAIAEHAGVSIGSVYHYFPNKQAIVANVTGRLNKRLLSRFRAISESGAPPAERLAQLLDAFCRPDAAEIKLRRALLIEVPRSWEGSGISESEMEVVSLFDSLARELGAGEPGAGEAGASDRGAGEAGASDSGDEASPSLADRQFALVFAVRGAVQGALLHRPDLLESGAMSRMMHELLLAVLRPSDAE